MLLFHLILIKQETEHMVFDNKSIKRSLYFKTIIKIESDLLICKVFLRVNQSTIIMFFAKTMTEMVV